MTLLNVPLFFSIFINSCILIYLKVSIHCSYYSYWCSNCPIFGQCDLSSSWLLGHFDITLFVFITPLLFDMARCSRLILHISSLRPRISHYSKKPYFIFNYFPNHVWEKFPFLNDMFFSWLLQSYSFW